MSNRKETLRKRRHLRTRYKVQGTEAKPRLVVVRTLLHTYAQLIDDTNGKVLAQSSDLKDKSKGEKLKKAKNIGIDIAKKAIEKKISDVVFDRNGYKYHGRAKAVAEGAREGGLKF